MTGVSELLTRIKERRNGTDRGDEDHGPDSERLPRAASSRVKVNGRPERGYEASSREEEKRQDDERAAEGLLARVQLGHGPERDPAQEQEEDGENGPPKGWEEGRRDQTVLQGTKRSQASRLTVEEPHLGHKALDVTVLPPTFSPGLLLGGVRFFPRVRAQGTAIIVRRDV